MNFEFIKDFGMNSIFQLLIFVHFSSSLSPIGFKQIWMRQKWKKVVQFQFLIKIYFKIPIRSERGPGINSFGRGRKAGGKKQKCSPLPSTHLPSPGTRQLASTIRSRTGPKYSSTQPTGNAGNCPGD